MQFKSLLLQSDRTCEYVYSLKMDQFAVHETHDQPMTLTATVQITCESGKLLYILKLLSTVLSVTTNNYKFLVHNSCRVILLSCLYNSWIIRIRECNSILYDYN